MTFSRLIQWLVRIAAALSLIALVGLTLLVASVWREHKTEISLPAPTGHFAVGRTTYTWINSDEINPTETDELAKSPATRREVVVWLWYPSVATPSAPTVEYLPAPWRSALAQHSSVLMSKFFTRDLSLVGTHSTSDPDISSGQNSFPVVIMRAGGGALTTDYTTLAEDLASHGYIVVGLDAPYRTFVVSLPQNRVVIRPSTNDPENLPADQANRLINRLLQMWISDTKFVVSQLERLNAADPSGKFTGRIDLYRLGMFGHSFGGAQALQFCHDDARCKAAIDLDGAPYGSVVQDGLKQPTMFIFSDHSHETADPSSTQIHADIESIYGRLPNDRFTITIRGAHHFIFSDQSLLNSQCLTRLLTLVLGSGKLEPRRGLAITASYVHTFFDIYLKGEPLTLLKNVSAQYPEVEVNPR